MAIPSERDTRHFNRLVPVTIILTLCFGLIFSGAGGSSSIPLVQSAGGTCLLKAGDLDTANECVITFPKAFHTFTSVVLQLNAESAVWNQSYTIFQGNLALTGVIGPLTNQTEFLQRGYAGIGEMIVNFESDVLGNCGATGATLFDQFSKDGTSWTNLGNGVKLDCTTGWSLDSFLGPVGCSSLAGVGFAFNCINNATIPGATGGINSTLAKNFQNTYNRLFLSTSSATAITLYRVDLNLVYQEPFFCTILFNTLTTFTPECGPSMGIQLTTPFTIAFQYTAYGT